jgi:uncharacterized protein (DUF697 family)
MPESDRSSAREKTRIMPRKRRRLYDTLSTDEEVALTQAVEEHKAEHERLYARTSQPDGGLEGQQTTDRSASDHRRDQAWRIVNRSVRRVSAIALIPLPVVDLAAVTYIQTDMLRKLAKTFDLDYHEPLVLNIISKVWKTYDGFTLGSGLLGSASKMIPFLGSMLGMGAVNYAAVGSTYSLGKLVIDENL